MNNEEFESRILITAELLKTALNVNNLYIGVSANTSEFVFIDRDEYRKGKQHVARISMDLINSIE